MPAGGRINRRDNLRSKKELTKTKKDKDTDSNSIQEKKLVVRNLGDIKLKNVATPSKKLKSTNYESVSSKSELIFDTLRTLYIYLEDINLTENVLDNIKESEVTDLEDVTESKIKSNIPKRKTKKAENYRPADSELFITDIMDCNTTKNIIETKNPVIESDEVVTNKVNKSPKKEDNIVKTETVKRKGRSRTNQVAESQNATEIVNDVVMTETLSKAKDVEKSQALRGKSRAHNKKDESELKSAISNQEEQIVSSEVAETKEPEQESGEQSSKLGRRSAFHKDISEKTEAMKVVLEKIEPNQPAETPSRRKIGVRSSRKQTINYKNDMETESSVVTKDSVDLDAGGEDNAMDVDQVETPPAVVPIPEKTVEPVATVPTKERKKAGRVTKSRVPFVIETVDGTTAAPAMKIPGLVMLENIRNRKSGIVKPPVAKETVVNPVSNGDGEKDIRSETRERITENKPVLSKPVKKEVPVESKPEPEKEPERTENEKSVAMEKKESRTKPKENQNILTEVTIRDEPAPVPVTHIPMETESTVTKVTKPEKSVAKKSRVSEKVKNKRESAAPPGDVGTTKIPGLRMIEDIRRRKSELLALNAPSSVATLPPPSPAPPRKTSVRQSIMPTTTSITSSVLKSPVPVPTPVAKETVVQKQDKVPGLATIEELKSYSRQSIHIDDGVGRQARKSSTVAVTTPVAMGSEKVPGLSVTSQLRKQKMASQAPLTPAVAQSPIVSRPVVKDTDMSSVTTPIRSLMPKPVAIQTPRSTPIGILCKPSPYKRPISCLGDTQDSGDDLGDGCHGTTLLGESRRKMARVQVEKRQSVTFNREVEVKEIHGNSFNSASDDAEQQPDEPNHHGNQLYRSAVPIEQAARAEFERKLESELERTKAFLQDRRLLGNRRPMETAMARQQMAVLTNPIRPLPKKSSDLSNLISQRAKLTSLSPPRVPLASSVARGNGGVGVSSGGASKKVTSVSSSRHVRRDAPTSGSRTLDQWKSFRNPQGIPDNADDDHSCRSYDDESMSGDDDASTDNNKNTNKQQDQGSKCLLM